MTWSRMPNCRARPCASARARMRSSRSAICVGRLAPRKIGVDVLGGDLFGGGRRATEEDLRGIPVAVVDTRTLDLVVVTVQIERRAGRRGPDAPKDGKELRGAEVSLVVAEVVAEPGLLDRVATRHDVQQQPSTRDALEGRRLVGGQGRRDEARSEGDQELQPCGHLGQGGRGDPGVLAPGSGRREHRLEPEELGGAGDFAEVSDGRRSDSARRRADGQVRVVARPDDLPAVAVGRQVPMQVNSHQRRGLCHQLRAATSQTITAISAARERFG